MPIDFDKIKDVIWEIEYFSEIENYTYSSPTYTKYKYEELLEIFERSEEELKCIFGDSFKDEWIKTIKNINIEKLKAMSKDEFEKYFGKCYYEKACIETEKTIKKLKSMSEEEISNLDDMIYEFLSLLSGLG